MRNNDHFFSIPDNLLYEKMKFNSTPFEDSDGIDELCKNLSTSKIVFLGDPTQGTQEFYQIKKKITQKLIDNYGFNIIATDDGYPNSIKIDKYINSSDKVLDQLVLNTNRWPSWVWSNEEFKDLIQWLKGKNVNFYGLSIYSLFESLQLIVNQCDKLPHSIANKIKNNYSDLKEFQDELSYVRSLIDSPSGCKEKVIENYKLIQSINSEDTLLTDKELFDLKQNSRILMNAEKYYRSIIYGVPKTWNIRSHHMMDSLHEILKRNNENSKAVVWCHSSHIADYHAAEKHKLGYVSMGGLSRDLLSKENISLVGFGTYQGEVVVSAERGSTPEICELPMVPAQTYENYLHYICEEINASQLYLSIPNELSINPKKGIRSIDLVYEPNQRSKWKYFDYIDLFNSYDAFIFIDHTSPLVLLENVIQNEEDVDPYSSNAWSIGV